MDYFTNFRCDNEENIYLEQCERHPDLEDMLVYLSRFTCFYFLVSKPQMIVTFTVRILSYIL